MYKNKTSGGQSWITMALKWYKKRYFFLLCTTLILLFLVNQLFFQQLTSSPRHLLLAFNISLVHDPISRKSESAEHGFDVIPNDIKPNLMDGDETVDSTGTENLDASIFTQNSTKINNGTKTVAGFPTSKHLEAVRKLALSSAEKAVGKEMAKFHFPDNTTLLERRKRPIRNIVVTSWRSGSTFIGQTMAAHPGTFYHYEPLLHYGIVQIREEPNSTTAVRHLRDLMQCNYSNMKEYIQYGHKHTYLFSHNERLWNYCKTNIAVCIDPKFLNSMCELYPVHAMKTVRLRLRLVRDLLEDPEIDLRVLYLARDPRGTMQSRLHRYWCPNQPDCDRPAALCSDLEDDFHEAERLRKVFPKRFMVVRFEDMSANVVESVKKIFDFFRLQYEGIVHDFVESHTKNDYGGVSSIYRNSKTAPFHWIQDLKDNYTYVDNVQKGCTKAMKLWGYNKAKDAKDLASPEFQPVSKPPWADMAFSPTA